MHKLNIATLLFAILAIKSAYSYTAIYGTTIIVEDISYRLGAVADFYYDTIEANAYVLIHEPVRELILVWDDASGEKDAWYFILQDGVTPVIHDCWIDSTEEDAIVKDLDSSGTDFNGITYTGRTFMIPLAGNGAGDSAADTDYDKDLNGALTLTVYYSNQNTAQEKLSQFNQVLYADSVDTEISYDGAGSDVISPTGIAGSLEHQGDGTGYMRWWDDEDRLEISIDQNEEDEFLVKLSLGYRASFSVGYTLDGVFMDLIGVYYSPPNGDQKQYIQLRDGYGSNIANSYINWDAQQDKELLGFKIEDSRITIQYKWKLAGDTNGQDIAFDPDTIMSNMKVQIGYLVDTATYDLALANVFTVEIDVNFGNIYGWAYRYINDNFKVYFRYLTSSNTVAGLVDDISDIEIAIWCDQIDSYVGILFEADGFVDWYRIIFNGDPSVEDMHSATLDSAGPNTLTLDGSGSEQQLRGALKLDDNTYIVKFTRPYLGDEEDEDEDWVGTQEEFTIRGFYGINGNTGDDPDFTDGTANAVLTDAVTTSFNISETFLPFGEIAFANLKPTNPYISFDYFEADADNEEDASIISVDNADDKIILLYDRTLDGWPLGQRQFIIAFGKLSDSVIFDMIRIRITDEEVVVEDGYGQIYAENQEFHEDASNRWTVLGYSYQAPTLYTTGRLLVRLETDVISDQSDPEAGDYDVQFQDSEDLLYLDVAHAFSRDADETDVSAFWWYMYEDTFFGVGEEPAEEESDSDLLEDEDDLEDFDSASLGRFDIGLLLISALVIFLMN